MHCQTPCLVKDIGLIHMKKPDFMDGDMASDDSFFSPADVVGNAVGVQSRKWYIAIVNNNTEKICWHRIASLGFEAYVPIQTETHLWKNGRRKIIDRVVIPSKVFIHCTETERLQKIVHLPYIKRFMTDRAGASNEFGWHPLAVVPDIQIEKLRFILFNSDKIVTIEPPPLRLGDKVRVARGKLMGLEGYVVRRDDGETDILVQLDVLGCARMNISKDDIEKIF